MDPPLQVTRLSRMPSLKGTVQHLVKSSRLKSHFISSVLFFYLREKTAATCFFSSDLNYIYLSTMKDKLKTRKRTYRKAV